MSNKRAVGRANFFLVDFDPLKTLLYIITLNASGTPIMGKLAHPYLLLLFAAAVACALATDIAQKRAELFRLRRRQEEVLSDLIGTNRKVVYYRRKRHELLSNPATIAEVAKEQYGYMWEGDYVSKFEPSQKPEESSSTRISIVETGWERLLGEGRYPWQLPVAVFGLCAAVFGVIGLVKVQPEGS